MKHLDLFSGIGGFAYAVDQVWDNAKHVFCDNDLFCRKVIKKHWPESEIYDDIRRITGYTDPVDLVTGGFPCQPFSQAGVRAGITDERYLWPEMLRVIQLTQPQWVIAENVSGLLTLQNGLVFEQICVDLEGGGYAVQPFIIPAVAVNAPHRRDRVWIVAHTNGRQPGRRRGAGREADSLPSDDRPPLLPRQPSRAVEDVADAAGERLSQRRNARSATKAGRSRGRRLGDNPDWNQDWLALATELCGVDDGLPARVGDFALTKAGHRNAQIKAYGNAIVPQVALEIMKGMKQSQ